MVFHDTSMTLRAPVTRRNGGKHRGGNSIARWHCQDRPPPPLVPKLASLLFCWATSTEQSSSLLHGKTVLVARAVDSRAADLGYLLSARCPPATTATALRLSDAPVFYILRITFSRKADCDVS